VVPTAAGRTDSLTTSLERTEAEGASTRIHLGVSDKRAQGPRRQAHSRFIGEVVDGTRSALAMSLSPDERSATYLPRGGKATVQLKDGRVAGLLY
jgi:hypothetical protein